MHEFTLEVHLQDHVFADASYAVHTETFTVTVIHPCDETLIDAIALDPVVTSLEIILPFPVTGSDKVGIPVEPEDSASQNYGAADGYSFCGARELHVIDLADNSEIDLATSSMVSFTNQILTFSPTEAGVW